MEEDECQSSENQDSDGCQKASKKKKKSSNSKRFSNEQVKSLETIFRLETKLETKKKLQVARELGLQPRQVAIWFQNKRARWKSKQIEQEYRVLKSKFDNLNVQFDSLKKEKEYLLIQSEKLRNELEMKSDAGQRIRQDSQVMENKNAEFEGRETLSFVFGEKFKHREEAEFLNLRELEGSPFASSDHWCSGSLNSPFDDSCGGPSKWWEF